MAPSDSRLQLRGVLHTACPTWSGNDVDCVQQKLAVLGVRSVSALAEVLEHEPVLNQLLRKCGLKAFRKQTVAALRACLALAGTADRAKVVKWPRADGEWEPSADSRWAEERWNGEMTQAGVPALRQAAPEPFAEAVPEAAPGAPREDSPEGPPEAVQAVAAAAPEIAEIGWCEALAEAWAPEADPVAPEVAQQARHLAEEAAFTAPFFEAEIAESFRVFEVIWRGVKAVAEAERFEAVSVAVEKHNKDGASSQVDFLVRIPAGGTAGTLRSILWPAVAEPVTVWGNPRGDSWVQLWDTEEVPHNVVLSDFPGRPHKFYARLSLQQCVEAHRMVKAWCVKAANQRKIEDIERDAGGDASRHMVLLANLLGDEVYPPILERFGMPKDVQPFQTLKHAFDSTYLDFEACKVWYETELLMRNRRKAVQAYAYLAHHCMKLGMPMPTLGDSFEVVTGGGATPEAGGGELDARLQHLRSPSRPDGGRTVFVQLPWAERLARRLPFVVAVVEDVYSPYEADNLRELAESRGNWKYAASKGRTGLITEMHIPGLAKDLWRRMAKLHLMDFGDKRAVGLSEHLRFLKYGPGHFFAPHEDSSQNCTMDDGVWARSVYSALLYLSEPEEGGVPGAGGTRFIAPDCPACAASGRCEDLCAQCVDGPVKKGAVLLFAQSLQHAGTMPRNGEKFVMRTDVMLAPK